MDANQDTDTIRRHLTSALGCTYVIGRALPPQGVTWAFGAWDMARGRPVVIRAVRRPAGATRRQIQAAMRWRHPHLNPILATGTTHDLLYYAMPLIEGESLRARLDREGPLDPHAVADIMRDVRGAVGHAHRHRLAYGLALDSIIVETATGRTWVTEFGSDTPTDPRSDLNNLDALGWQMLLGRLPDPSQLSVPVASGSHPLRGIEDWVVAAAATASDRWRHVSPHVSPHVTPRRTLMALAAVLLLAVLGGRQATPLIALADISGTDAAPLPVLSPTAQRIDQMTILDPAPAVDPPPVAATSSGDVQTPVGSEDDHALDRAYRAVAGAFPGAARRELAQAQQVWHADRDRACARHSARQRCEHALTTRRLAELNDLLARATAR
jgi:Lysozyme inhibitor LprI